MPDHAALLARLRSVVGPQHVLSEQDQRAGYELDWTGAWSGTALAVVRPGDEDEVHEVVRACVEHGVAIVPQGGNTGLVGGGVPVDGGVVLSTRRLDTLLPVTADGTVLVGAGATLASVQRHAANAGWQLGVDLAAREQATIGGMVATDAGGVRVVGSGPMREHVVGLVVVTPDGVRRTGAPTATGRDVLVDELIGSEGTLGVITSVQLQLRRPRVVAAAVLLRIAAFAEVSAAVTSVLTKARRAGADVLACELMTSAGLTLVAETLGVAVPVVAAHGAVLMVELAEPADAAAIATLCEGVDDDPVVALDTEGRRRLWELRERHTEVVASVHRPVKLDVAVPVARLGEALGRVEAAVSAVAPHARVICWGHAAEGRLHVNVLDASDQEQPVTAAVYDLVAAVGGTVVSEHGAGRAKLPYLHLTGDPTAIARARARKQAVDPRGLLNPGVRLPAADDHDS